MAGHIVTFKAADGRTELRELPREAFRFGVAGGRVRFDTVADRDAEHRADPLAQLRDERDRLKRQVDEVKAKVRALRAQLGLPPDDEPATVEDAEFSAWFGKFAAREWPHAPALRASPLVRAAAVQRFQAERQAQPGKPESILVRLARGSGQGGPWH